MNKKMIFLVFLLGAVCLGYSNPVTFSGTVKDQAGNPIPGATVYLSLLDPQQTNQNGEFSFTFPQPITYTFLRLEVSANQYNYYEYILQNGLPADDSKNVVMTHPTTRVVYQSPKPGNCPEGVNYLHVTGPPTVCTTRPWIWFLGIG